MPELRFIMNGEDELEFMRLIFREEGRVIPDYNYLKPKYVELVTEPEYQASRATIRRCGNRMKAA